MTEAVFARHGEGFMPTEYAVGPWDPSALHGGAPAALIARAFDQLEPEAPMTWARFGVDLLRPVPRAELRVEARVSRPGRKVQVLEASLSAAGVEVARASGLRIRTEALSLPAVEPQAATMRPPEESRPSDLMVRVGFGSAMEIRLAGGRLGRPGPAAVWFRLRVPVVEGEEPTPLMRVAAAADFGNGISHELDFTAYVFINPEVTVHLYREPAGEWIGLDASTRLGPAGVGLAESVLHDASGPFGRAAQSLLLGVRNEGARM